MVFIRMVSIEATSTGWRTIYTYVDLHSTPISRIANVLTDEEPYLYSLQDLNGHSVPGET